METHTRNQSIGKEITNNVQEGDNLIISTEKESNIEVTVIECPTFIPVKEYDTSEVICKPDNPIISEDEIISLYAYMEKMGETYIEYDLYALRLTGVSDTEELGEITELKSENES